MRENEAFKGKKHDLDRYLDYMHGQVKELCTNYGKIDIFWFDFSYDDMSGETWRATELVRMVRGYWPDVLIDNRLEGAGHGYGSLMTDDPSEFSGDFICPEQIIPLDGFKTESGKPIIWEACITMNNNWGYSVSDKNFKPAEMLVRKLVECVSKGGNLLLNIGPDAKGSIPEESQKILAEIGKWMKKNSESIYGCEGAGIGKPEYGWITRKGNILYYHVTESQINAVPLIGIKRNQISRMWYAASGAELKQHESIFLHAYEGMPFASFGESPLLPDPVDTVIGVELCK